VSTIVAGMIGVE